MLRLNAWLIVALLSCSGCFVDVTENPDAGLFLCDSDEDCVEDFSCIPAGKASYCLRGCVGGQVVACGGGERSFFCGGLGGSNYCLPCFPDCKGQQQCAMVMANVPSGTCVSPSADE